MIYYCRPAKHTKYFTLSKLSKDKNITDEPHEMIYYCKPAKHTKYFTLSKPFKDKNITDEPHEMTIDIENMNIIYLHISRISWAERLYQ